MAKDGAPQVPLPKNYGDEGVWTFFLCQLKQEKFLHLELQNKAHKLFGTISSWAQICGAKKLTSISKGRLSFIISRMDRGQKYVQTNSSTVMIQGFKKTTTTLQNF